MSYKRMKLRHLCFTGPAKETALIPFEAGLNVLYGASETGKSFVLEAIDFMLGGKNPLRDISEREGYDRVFLALEDLEGKKFTLVRAASGGSFNVFEGLHASLPEDQEGEILSFQPSKKNPITISNYLLDRIGLAGSEIVKNKRNECINLSFRNVVRLCCVSEEEIHKTDSPIESGQVMLKTPEYATFKLLLTGVDDSAVVSAESDPTASQSRSAKIEMLDELLEGLKLRIGMDEAGRKETSEQLERLEESIEREEQILQQSEKEYQVLTAHRSNLRRRLESGTERRGEIGELSARFKLLEEHYTSDLNRLEAIAEAGSLMAALSPQECPLCGSEPDVQHLSKDCDGNLEIVVKAADFEMSKIVQLRDELQQTMADLSIEAGSFDSLLPKLGDQLDDVDVKMNDAGEGLAQVRTGYRELVDQQADIKSTFSLWDQFEVLEARRIELEGSGEAKGTQTQVATGLSTTTLDRFARQIETLLRAWNFPDSERVHFEVQNRDLVINGRQRGSRGKGMRAITHAAFTIGLMEYCCTHNKPHPGFVVLDSPLLAYREPEGTDDDLDGTDVHEKFYEYLTQLSEQQVFVIENTDPPTSIREREGTIFFSKNPTQGRYGFF
jgi:hypothetical protein